MKFLHDARYALRNLAHAPGFTAVAVLTLALGIGATTAIFSAVDALLIRSLPYPNADRLVMLWVDATKRDMPRTEWTNAADAGDWATALTRVESLYAFSGWGPTLTGKGDPAQLAGAVVTHRFFDVLGVRPALGRGFRAEDDVPGAPSVVVVSHGFWQRRLGGDPAAVGGSIVLDGRPATIVGVAPPGFAMPLTTDRDLWRPLQQGSDNRGGFYLRTVARLAPGTTLEAAQAEFAGVQARLAAAYPDTNADLGGYVQPLRDAVAGPVRDQILVLFGATTFVLLIACANLANLLLTRATGRAREFAVRAALGAGRARLVQQLLTESGVLALCGAALGLAIAYALVGWFGAQLPPNVARVAPPALDVRVFGFALLTAVGAGLLFGAAPAFAATRRDLVGTLRDGDRGASGGRGARRLRAALVTGTFALALALTVGAGLFLKSLVGLTRVDLGFRPESLLTFTLALPEASYENGDALRAFQSALVERLEALPGVDSVGLTSTLPLAGVNTDTTLRMMPAGGGEPVEVRAWFSRISAGYTETLGAPLRRGRAIAATDRAGAPNVIVVNEAFAREHFPGRDPLGERLYGGTAQAPVPFEIVGVVGDVRFFGLDQAQTPSAYIALAQRPSRQFFVALRGAGDAAATLDAARRAVAALDPGLPLSNVAPMTTLVSDSLRTPRLVATLTGAFAALALLLAALGVYGVLAYSVAARTREFGVRMALGAAPRALLGQVLGGGLKLALAGVLLGAAFALAVGRSLAALLYEVEPFDPQVFALVGGLLVAVAVLAALLPAWRASRIDPIEALRYE